MSRQREDTLPWYRQFWPWFLMALPAAVVVAGISTLIIALRNPHAMVNDDYYREGLAINQRLEQDRVAAELEMTAELRLDAEREEVTVRLQGAASPAQLSLLLIHPLDDRQDLRLELNHTPDGLYIGTLTVPLAGSYYLRLLPPDETWRLNGQLDLQQGNQVRLESL